MVVTGSTSAIGMLWTWCAELARDVGLLGPVAGAAGSAGEVGSEADPDRTG